MPPFDQSSVCILLAEVDCLCPICVGKFDGELLLQNLTLSMIRLRSKLDGSLQFPDTKL
jgi:hypothetical protein